VCGYVGHFGAGAEMNGERGEVFLKQRRDPFVEFGGVAVAEPGFYGNRQAARAALERANDLLGECGVLISAAPAPDFSTPRSGQPILISTPSKPSSLIRAPTASNCSGLEPKYLGYDGVFTIAEPQVGQKAFAPSGEQAFNRHEFCPKDVRFSAFHEHASKSFVGNVRHWGDRHDRTGSVSQKF